MADLPLEVMTKYLNSSLFVSDEPRQYFTMCIVENEKGNEFNTKINVLFCPVARKW